MNEKCAEIDVAAFADVPQAPPLAAGIFTGCDTQIAGEATSRRKALDIADKGDQRRSCEKADARHGAQARDQGVLSRHLSELPLDIEDAFFKLADLTPCFGQGGSEELGDVVFSIFEKFPQPGHDESSSQGDGEAKFTQVATNGVEASGAYSHPARAKAVKGHQSLLLDRFDGDRFDVLIAMGLKQRFCISLVGLVAQDIGARSMSREKDGFVPELLQLPGPVMGGTAGLQENCGGLEFCEEWQKPTPGEAMALRDNTGTPRDGNLKNILGKINSDDRILHSGLLLCFLGNDSGTMMPTESLTLEESIPSMKLPVAFGARSLSETLGELEEWHSWRRSMVAYLFILLVLGGTVDERSDFETVQRYRAALNKHDTETAMSLLAEDYKLRFVGTEFVISKDDLPRILGWDTSVNGHVEWDIAEGKTEPLTFEGRERNDFFGLLGISHLRFRTIFRVDANGKIIEQLYEAHPNQPSWEEAIKPAITWASEHRPRELHEIYPDGKIIYTEEMGRRWVTLLREWNSSKLK